MGLRSHSTEKWPKKLECSVIFSETKAIGGRNIIFDYYILVCYKVMMMMMIIIIINNKCAFSRTLGKWKSCLASVTMYEYLGLNDSTSF
jgi:hypothetical protein